DVLVDLVEKWFNAYEPIAFDAAVLVKNVRVGPRGRGERTGIIETGVVAVERHLDAWVNGHIHAGIHELQAGINVVGLPVAAAQRRIEAVGPIKIARAKLDVLADQVADRA